MSAEKANKRIHAGDHVLAYIPANPIHPIQFLHYEFVVKRIDSESVTLENFDGGEWTFSLSMLNMILLNKNGFWSKLKAFLKAAFWPFKDDAESLTKGEA